MAANKNLEDVRQVMIETARIQFATLNAGIVFWSVWVESASKQAQKINEELMNLGKEGTDTDTVLSTITNSSREYLRTLTELPNAAVARFNKDVAAGTAPKPNRSRVARAKE